MRISACLRSDVRAFDFHASDLAALQSAWPDAELRVHRDYRALRAAGGDAEYLLVWEFQAGWYRDFPALRAIFTPAAGRDWVAADPDKRVAVRHGTFHGPLLAESLLGAILFMNRRMPAMLRNHARRGWDRDLQADARLLRNQTVLILGFGHIGSACARLLQTLGARVVGIKRDPASRPDPALEVPLYPPGELDALLPQVEHVVLLLPRGAGSERILDAARLRRCRPGVFLYNFGRGNAIASEDLIAAGDHIGGAFLDVVDQEPLDPGSPLWSMDNVMITPHSSCIGREYKEAFVAEVIARLTSGA